jgi:energy-coupling factor transport system permease protein
VRRELHPGAWWLWALGLATAASRTTNPFLLLTVLIVVFVVTRACRPDRSSAGGFRGYLILAAVVIGIRVVFRIVLGGGGGTHVLFRLPEFPLPAAASIRAGGAVTAESVVGAVYDGLRLATLLVCFGAANVLANPKRLIKAAPAALHEVGVAVTVAVAVAPQLVDSARRVRRARRLRRGSATGRMHLVRQVLLPVMTDALDRSLMLAAAMDARGHGRVAGIPERTRRLSGASLLIGMCGVCVGTYALLDGTVSRWIGVPAMALGVALSAWGVVLGNRRIASTVYRPDPWRRPEWLVAACGAAVALGLVAFAHVGSGDLNPSASLLEWPVLPLAAFVIVLLGALPVVVA